MRGFADAWGGSTSGPGIHRLRGRTWPRPHRGCLPRRMRLVIWLRGCTTGRLRRHARLLRCVFGRHCGTSSWLSCPAESRPSVGVSPLMQTNSCRVRGHDPCYKQSAIRPTVHSTHHADFSRNGDLFGRIGASPSRWRLGLQAQKRRRHFRRAAPERQRPRVVRIAVVLSREAIAQERQLLGGSKFAMSASSVQPPDSRSSGMQPRDVAAGVYESLVSE